MKKLIELDAAIKETWKDTGYTDPLNVMTAIRDRLEALPTVDAVPVVRCKDCDYWTGRKYNVHINGFLPWCRFSALQREANDFCSYGRRKDGNRHEAD